MWLILAKGCLLLHSCTDWWTTPPPLIPINALTLQDFKHDCSTIGMFSSTAIPTAIGSEKLSRRCPTHPPPSRCKTSVQIYLFQRGPVIFKDHLVWGEGWMMAAERARPWRCKNINWLTLPSRRQFDSSFLHKVVIDRSQVAAFLTNSQKHCCRLFMSEILTTIFIVGQFFTNFCTGRSFDKIICGLSLEKPQKRLIQNLVNNESPFLFLWGNRNEQKV